MAKAKRKKATPTGKAAKPKAKQAPARRKPAAKPAATKPVAKKPAKKAKPPREALAPPTADAAPSEGPILATDRLLTTLAAISPRLASDSIYANEANAPFDAGELEGYFRRADGVTLGYLFGETLQGMIQSVRFSALRVVRALFHDDEQTTITTKPALQIPQGGTLAIVGDLVVEGDLDNDGVLVVTGNLTVRGAYVGPAFDYSLAAVGGTLRARDVSASGEILVGERLEANRIVHLFYNDYSSILPALKAKALVIDDNFPALGTVEAEIQIDGAPSDDQLRAIFGASAETLTDDDESPIRTLIRS